MTKKWVQISPYQAKVIEEPLGIVASIRLSMGILSEFMSFSIMGLDLLKVISLREPKPGATPLRPIFRSTLILFVIFIILFAILSRLIIELIEFYLLHGEPISKSVIDVIELLPLIFSCTISIVLSILICLDIPVNDELIFDLDQGTLTHLVRSRFAKLLKRPSSIKKRLRLSNYSKVSLRVDSDLDSDNNRYYFYSLVMSGDSQNNYFQIDCSSGSYSLDKLDRKELAELEHLGRQLADFLQIPLVSEIDRDIETAVEKIYKTLKSSFGQSHEYRIVNSEDFWGYVDLAYYHRLQSALIEQGYTWAGDIEDMTVAEELREYNSRTFIRVMINSTHNTSIGFYHFNPKIPLGFLVQAKVIDCETEFSPEKYLVTTNVSKTPFDYPPGFDVVHLPGNTSYKNVLKTHYQRLQRAMSNWGLFPTNLHSLEDVLAMQKRMQQAKVTYRKRIGYITQEELNRFKVSPEIAREVGRRLRERFTHDS